MLRLSSLHATVADKPILKGLSFTMSAGGVQKLLGISLEGSVG